MKSRFPVCAMQGASRVPQQLKSTIRELGDPIGSNFLLDILHR
jgi:hypothetical protein